MISSSQNMASTPRAYKLKPRFFTQPLHSLLICVTLLLGAASTRTPLPETVALLNTSHFAQLESMQNGGKELFAERIETRLPKYKGLISGAASENHMDWHLLAAMSYQESFWNPDATSPTGVRGFMMLTRETADEMDVNNRLDPRQSINAGATYFSQLRDRIPEQIQEPNRTYMALAAYNMGMSHLEDARVLTEYYGKDPNSWDDVKDFAPLLAQKEYYSALKSGFARGDEAVAYVQRIQEYTTVLAWHTRIEERALATTQNNNGMTYTNTFFSNWTSSSSL